MLKKRVLLLIGVVCIISVALLFPYLKQGLPILYGLFFQKEIDLKTTESNNSVNILLLGRGGGKHDGPDLTDTMIYANINASTNTVHMVSLPRDIWVPELKAKINEAYAQGQKSNNKGMVLSRAVAEKVTGQTIDYVFVIDFSGFVKLVDFLGGVEVTVPNSFDDHAYPIEGKENELCGQKEEDVDQIIATSASELEAFPCRYKHIHFDKGVVTMNGQKALEFVRSRHAVGEEGTDFARAKRQQAVIASVREKALSLGILLNPVKVVGVYNILKDHIDMTALPEEYDDFIKLAKKMQNPTIKSVVIGENKEEEEVYGLLENPPVSKDYKYQWVLIPRKGNGDFSEIAEYLECIQAEHVCEIGKDKILTSHNDSITPKSDK